uniref:DUF2963 domain-containing protein n=1 Tax=Phytoplasma sp. CPh TaxID=343511 RepID=Q2LKX2_9MOLU|nr:hypothetical protein [Phytoplasma sp. CPh]
MKTTKKEFIDDYGSKVIQKYNANHQLIEEIHHYRGDGPINYIIQYNPLTGYKLKQTKYHQNFFRDQVIKYDKETGKEIKETRYSWFDDKIIHYISKFNKRTGEFMKRFIYSSDGKTIEQIIEYDKKTNQQTIKKIKKRSKQ